MESYRDKILGIENMNYFYTGAESPPLKITEDAMTQYLIDKSLGEIGRERASNVEKQLKTNFAKLINAKENEIAFAGNASEAINNIVNAMHIKPGSNVVLNDLEYPSVYLPWLSLKNQMDIELRILKSVDGEISVEEIEKNIDEKTCLVAVSHVSFLNGFRHDLKKLKELTDMKNVPLLVDATQSLGVVEVDSNYTDMLVSSSYKWLLGPHGLGLMYISEEYLEKLQPKRIGWRSVQTIFHNERFERYYLNHDATKFELGFNNYPAIYALKSSTDFLLEIGIENIEKRVLRLGGELIRQLKGTGWKLLTPEDEEKRAGNISVVSKHGEKIMEYLISKDVMVWGGDGRLRFSVNFYNTEDEINNLVHELKLIKEKERELF